MGGGRDRGDASVGGLVTTYRGEVEAVDQRMRRQMAEWRRRDDVAQGAEDGDEVGGGGAVREGRTAGSSPRLQVWMMPYPLFSRRDSNRIYSRI